MGRVKVPFSAGVFESFFQKSDKAFQVTTGLPESARLVDVVYDYRKKQGVAVFEDRSFPDLPDGLFDGAFEYKVEYTAYQLLAEDKGIQN
jgi:hypothetical protein